MQNNGSAAEEAFERHWMKIGHVQRIRDKKDLMGLNKMRNIADFTKPSDFIVSSPYHPLHFAEVKSTQHDKGFPFGGIQDAQHVAAIKEARRGSGSYIFYIFSMTRGEWFTMPCTMYADLIDAGKRSVKFEDLIPWTK